MWARRLVSHLVVAAVAATVAWASSAARPVADASPGAQPCDPAPSRVHRTVFTPSAPFVQPSTRAPAEARADWDPSHDVDLAARHPDDGALETRAREAAAACERLGATTVVDCSAFPCTVIVASSGDAKIEPAQCGFGGDDLPVYRVTRSLQSGRDFGPRWVHTLALGTYADIEHAFGDAQNARRAVADLLELRRIEAQSALAGVARAEATP